MTEYKVLNLVLFINSLIILNAIFFPWILVEKTFDLNENCTIYSGDYIGLYFDDICGVDIAIYESKFNIIRWLSALTALPALLSFVIFNWHIQTFTFENAERIVLLVLSLCEIALLIVIIYFWSDIDFNFLPHSNVTFFGFGYISLLLSLFIWASLLIWNTISIFILKEE